jgi:hypothetical protein
MEHSQTFQDDIEQIVNRAPVESRPVVRAMIELLIAKVDKQVYQDTYTEITETMRKAGK